MQNTNGKLDDNGRTLWGKDKTPTDVIDSCEKMSFQLVFDSNGRASLLFPTQFSTQSKVWNNVKPPEMAALHINDGALSEGRSWRLVFFVAQTIWTGKNLRAH